MARPLSSLDTLGASAESLVLTPLRQSIIRLHNDPVFTPAEKRKSEAYIQQHRTDVGKLILWKKQLVKHFDARKAPGTGPHDWCETRQLSPDEVEAIIEKHGIERYYD